MVKQLPPVIAVEIEDMQKCLQGISNHCRVAIDKEQNNRIKGIMFRVTIKMALLGKEISSRKQNQNLYIALRDGFAAIEKLLEKQFKRKNTTRKYLFSLGEHHIHTEIQSH